MTYTVQQGLWFSWQLAPENSAFNIAIGFRLCSKLNITNVKASLQIINERHAILRSRFLMLDNVLCQQIVSDMPVDFEQVAASGWDEQQLRDNVTEAQDKAFDIEHGQLMRVRLFSLSDDEHLLLFVVHHIVSDAMSQGIITEEFLKTYEALETDVKGALPTLQHAFTDYVLWEKKMLLGEKGKQLWNYWQQKLNGNLPLLSLPIDYPRPAMMTYNGASVRFDIALDLNKQIKKLCKDSGVTSYVFILAVYKVLLYRYASQDEIIVGSPMSGRSRYEFRDLVGCFVNPVVLRSHVDGNISFKDFLGKVQQTVIEAMNHQDYPFPLLVERLGIPHNPSYSPVYQATFNLHNFNLFSSMQHLLSDGETQKGSLLIKKYNLVQQEGQGDLYLELIEANESLYGAFKYNTDLFKPETIARFITHFITLLGSVIENPASKIAELNNLPLQEKEQLLSTFNDTHYPYRKDICIHELFEEQVLRSPDAVAVEFGDESLTYSELNEKANQLGHYLREKGVKAETLVGVFVGRSIDMIISLYGIMKAGGAYVPIDPFYPAERSSYILEDSGCTLLLTHRYLQDRLPVTGVPELVCLDDVLVGTALAAQSKHNILSVVQPVNLAYVIYTSGSTGRPKGTLIEHRSLVNRLDWMQRSYPVNEQDTLLQKTTYTFDVSVWELFWWSLYGARLCILAPGAEKDPEAIVSTIARYSVSTIHFVPSMYSVFLDYVNTGKHHGQLRSLRQIFTSGEALAGNHVAQSEVLMLENGTQLINLYGPTEATIDVSYYNCKPSDRVIPIGKPISNTQLYIVDPYNQVVPIGVAGELCIAGDGLARGYLNREDLTAEKFVRNVFSTESGSLLYKTGDLARFRSDGNIEYLGRLDNQVKIRGFRIELGEIEQVLSEQPELISNVVVAGKDKQGNNRLIAYVVAGEDAAFDVESLREGLLKRLPEYMLPSLFIKLESMPLTASGKIDRKALPEAELNIETTQAYVAPESETEQKLALIWQEVLGLEKVGIHHNFFELGGHSLLATQVVSKIRVEFNKELALKGLFENNSIHALAKQIDSNEQLTARLAPITRKDNLSIGEALFGNNTMDSEECNVEEFNI